MRKELQHALTQESSMCQDQLQQALRQQICQEEICRSESTGEMNQLRRLIAKQAEAMQRFESHSQQFVSQQRKKSMFTSSMLSSSSLTVLSGTRMR